MPCLLPFLPELGVAVRAVLQHQMEYVFGWDLRRIGIDRAASPFSEQAAAHCHSGFHPHGFRNAFGRIVSRI
jgi:hypothetical protein